MTDVDGSLVTPDKTLTPRALAAVEALDAAGIAFAITSGRPPRGLATVIEPLHLKTPIAAFNGGLFVTPELSTLEEHTLAPDASRATVELIQQHGLDVWVYSGKDWLVRDREAPHVAHEQETVKFPPKVVADFGQALDHAVKIVAVSDDHDRLADCEGAVRRKLTTSAAASRSQPYYLDVTHPLANKGEVVETLSRMLSIPTNEIVAVGDGFNDTQMFERSAISIAMGNATDAVKDAAHHVTDPNDDDGFAKAMERIVIDRAAKPTGM